MPVPRTPAFRGRARERQALDGLLDRVRGGESAVLVIRGEAGIGKTSLMHYCARQASGCQLAQIHGVESEMELPLAALHQLCTPMLSSLDALPEPQQRVLRVAFGLTSEPAPDRFVLGLAVLSLLAENAAARPLICLIDDAQWLDDASSQVLGFVGRRLLAEPVGLLLAVRETAGEPPFPGLPALPLEGLTDQDARALLTAAIPGQLDNRVRDRMVAETGGNPLGLLELARGMSEAELAGGFTDPPQVNLPGPTSRAGSRTTTCAGFRCCPGQPGSSCCWRRPTRRGTPRCCGGPRRSWDWDLTRRPRSTRSSCWTSAPRYGSAIHWCGRLPMRPDPRRIAVPPT